MAQTAFILILATDRDRGEALTQLLRNRYGHACKLELNLADAQRSIAQRPPDVVVSAAEVDGRPVARALAEALNQAKQGATLLLVGPSDAPTHIGATEIIKLPLEGDVAELVDPIGAAAADAVARRADQALIDALEQHKFEVFEGIVGISPAIKRIVERVRKAARTNLTVLILGETGTGKELIAEAIHQQSPRARKPFLALNCAGVSESLLESTLFGHVRGAFTGAVADQKGYFVAADGGTLFLDEVGDMPAPMQAKLLRALERREVTPVGSTEIRRVDVRVVAATNTDLRQAMSDKKFRDDLYYRLNQWRIDLPPLRDRPQDIPLLAYFMLQEANKRHGTRVPGISSAAMEALTRHHWPGNVRELKNTMEMLAVEVFDRSIELDDLPEEMRGSREIVPVSGGLVGLTMAEIEKLMIERTLQSTGGNRDQAAKMLGIGTRTLYRKIKEYEL